MIKGLLPVIYTTAGVAVAGGVGYVALEQSSQGTTEPAAIVDVDAGGQNRIASLYQEPASAGGDQPAARTPDIAAEEVEVPNPEAAEVAPPLPSPTFTLLRVEPDGSAVIAGSGPASSEIILFDGEEELATTSTGPVGDFVFVLDQPLAPGLHELHLLARTADDREIASAAAGIVEVPEPDRIEEPTVLVTEAGEATRVLQQPEAEAPVENALEQTAEIKPDPTEPETQTAEIAQAEAETQKPLAEDITSQSPTQTVAGVAEPQAEPEPDVAEKAETETPEADVVIASVEPEQKAEPEQPAEPVTQELRVKPVLIEAADIEEENVYIAGTGEPNMKVNLYFGNELLGTATVLPNGAFLFEGEKKIEAGSHDLRADMVEADGKKVVARAEVTLLHEPEPTPYPQPTVDVAEPATNTAPEDETREIASVQQATQPVQIPKVIVDAEPEKSLPAPANKPVTKQEEPTDTKQQAAAKPLKQVEVKRKVQVAEKGEPRKPAVTAELPKETKPLKQAREQLKSSVVEENAPEDKPLEETVATSEPTIPPKTAKPAKKIIRTGTAVIIRRGDNLWRVARRNYGDGIRYTTIFEANASQIRNPNLIYPGQVFKLPEDKKS